MLLFELSNVELNIYISVCLFISLQRDGNARECFLPSLPTPLELFPTDTFMHICFGKSTRTLRVGTAASTTVVVEDFAASGCWSFFFLCHLLVGLPALVLCNPFQLKLAGLVKAVI